MYRGTTPTIRYKIKNQINLDTIQSIWVTFKSDTKILNLEKERCTFNNEEDNKSVVVNLTQEETLLFRNEIVETQLSVKFADENVCKGPILKIEWNRVLKEGEMV